MKNLELRLESRTGAGHDLNLHYQAPLTYAVVLNWMDRRVGRNSNVPPRFPCQP